MTRVGSRTSKRAFSPGMRRALPREAFPSPQADEAFDDFAVAAKDWVGAGCPGVRVSSRHGRRLGSAGKKKRLGDWLDLPLRVCPVE